MCLIPALREVLGPLVGVLLVVAQYWAFCLCWRFCSGGDGGRLFGGDQWLSMLAFCPYALFSKLGNENCLIHVGREGTTCDSKALGLYVSEGLE